jgi:hypothetical protein
MELHALVAGAFCRKMSIEKRVNFLGDLSRLLTICWRTKHSALF